MTLAKATQRILGKLASAVLALAVSSAMLSAQTASAARYDNEIQSKVTQKLSAKSQFKSVKSNVEDGIVTLTGTVDLYQRKLDAAKTARKIANVQGVHNLINVAGPAVTDTEIADNLSKKLTYVREGYDSTFDYFALGVKDGVVTVEGQDRTGVGRDEALADIANTPGVKDVVSQIAVEPVSQFDDGIRLRTLRAIYGDPVLRKYAIDPARPIRIIVANGHVTLYGAVDNKMDKQIAGMRAGQVFGSFSVDNKLQVASGSNQQGI